MLAKLVTRQRWTRVVALLREYQNHVVTKGEEVPKWMQNTDVSMYIESNHSLSNPHQRAADLELLFTYGANPNGVSATSGSTPVKKAAKRPDYTCLPILLRKGAKPADMVLRPGSTPLHVALNIALELDKGNFEILETLFKLQKESPDLHEDLDPQVTDNQGDTLFHVAAKAHSKHALKAVELLREHKVNPNIRNKAHKTALECLQKRKDRRAQFIKSAGRNFAPPKAVKKDQKPVVLESSQPIVESKEESAPTSESKPSTSPAAKVVNVSSSHRNVYITQFTFGLGTYLTLMFNTGFA